MFLCPGIRIDMKFRRSTSTSFGAMIEEGCTIVIFITIQKKDCQELHKIQRPNVCRKLCQHLNIAMVFTVLSHITLLEGQQSEVDLGNAFHRVLS